MKRFTVAMMAAGALFAVAPGASSADSSTPSNCWGQLHAGAAPGAVGVVASTYAHYFQSIGTNLGQTGVPAGKAACPAPIPFPPPTG